MRTWLFLALMTGCGGTVADPIDGSVVDATPDRIVADSPGDNQRPDAALPDCKAMEAKLAMLREQMLTCCPFCNSIQCNHVTQDVCCPISTTATNVSEFEALVS